jgi:phosphoenolpyruvate carboxylase
LPFDSIDNGALLPLFTDVCESGFKKADSKEIVDYFMNKYSHSTDEADKIDIMFYPIYRASNRLFDAVEDAAFPM